MDKPFTRDDVVIGVMSCCGADYTYPFDHKWWCLYHGVVDSKRKKRRPVNKFSPFKEGDTVVDYHTKKEYRMIQGEWKEVL